MQRTRFYDGRIDFLRLDKGKADYLLVNATIDRFLLYQTYEFYEIKKILQIDIVNEVTASNIRGLVTILYDYLEYKNSKVIICTKYPSLLTNSNIFNAVYDSYIKKGRHLNLVQKSTNIS
ncbi:hypothetical protein [Candidatus Uabimicrobium sp. HlEnr_7]|uniref:hypothetical protein n=1 Tax=Candidatus Uabimicrobium helgolandensis TaxID=3095367 RepID=UPI0035583559